MVLFGGVLEPKRASGRVETRSIGLCRQAASETSCAVVVGIPLFSRFMQMNAGPVTVDYDDVAIIRADYRLQHLLPHARLSPSNQEVAADCL